MDPFVDLDLFYGTVNFGSIWHLNGKKLKIFHSFVVIVLISMEMKSSPSLLNARGRGHLVTFGQGHFN